MLVFYRQHTSLHPDVTLHLLLCTVEECTCEHAAVTRQTCCDTVCEYSLMVGNDICDHHKHHNDTEDQISSQNGSLCIIYALKLILSVVLFLLCFY